MKKRSMLGIICILLLSYFCVGTSFLKVSAVETGEEILLKVFDKSEADILETNVHLSLNLENHFFELKELKEIKQELITDFNLEGEIELIHNKESYDPQIIYEHEDFSLNTFYVTEISETDLNQITGTFIHRNGDVTAFILHSTKYGDQKQSYIILDTTKSKSYDNMISDLEKSKNVLKKYGNDIDITTSLVGTFPGRLSQEETTNKIDKLIGFAKGKTVEKVTDNIYTSVTAYTPYLGEVIQYGKNTVNFNIAMRYSGYEDQTYLWVATPLITTSY
ncbi:YwmB family TATA-box binding protein [Serpentinicella sp. ANB-PHB4]|uniref:YwmB family TATA-box binding protein n=1 Tax=Serpentinicella sp. ANB-PHB4 TaxID=3074076 RepID=UPI00286211A6|nr:YwmB family TATA-box binding protein [Serpentinicella sp. ANB-PHB4]MDR5659708.1 YwmB family TATA-box binding protein [Serpentinicella sp. ANB-PHB4]